MCKYGPADTTATLSSLASLKSRLVYAFWCWLTQMVLEKRQLNGCSSEEGFIVLWVGFSCMWHWARLCLASRCTRFSARWHVDVARHLMTHCTVYCTCCLVCTLWLWTICGRCSFCGFAFALRCPRMSYDWPPKLPHTDGQIPASLMESWAVVPEGEKFRIWSGIRTTDWHTRTVGMLIL